MAQKTVVVAGAGPNGLAAAVAMARAGFLVIVREAAEQIGGGTRTDELTLPGYLHDVCSAVHPMGAVSPFFRELDLAAHGLEWVHPPILMAHPFDDGTAVALHRSLDETAASIGGADGRAYRRLMRPFVERAQDVIADVLAPPLRVPRHPLLMARFALSGLRSALGLVRARFEDDRACAFFAGMAAHTTLPLDHAPSAAFGLVLALAGHTAGWPIARGGSRRIADALASILRAHGGRIETNAPVTALDELRNAHVVLLDLTPRQILRIAGDAFPGDYARQLHRFRYAPGVFKLDWALAEPIPWTAPECRQAGTIHLGPTTAAIAASAEAAWYGRRDEFPWVILAQPTLFDPTRAPEGGHIAWAYCHVPHASTHDMTAAIEAQVERFAPGFRDTIVARSVLGPGALEAHNANLVGGDINGGVHDVRQFLFRPISAMDPYRTPLDNVFLCSASTPPGGAVHGMSGYHAARSALRRFAP